MNNFVNAIPHIWKSLTASRCSHNLWAPFVSYLIYFSCKTGKNVLWQFCMKVGCKTWPPRRPGPQGPRLKYPSTSWTNSVSYTSLLMSTESTQGSFAMFRCKHKVDWLWWHHMSSSAFTKLTLPLCLSPSLESNYLFKSFQ